jgi:hypothetical protein
MSYLFAVEEPLTCGWPAPCEGLQDALRKLSDGQQFRPSVLCRVRLRTAHSMPKVRLSQSAECKILWRLRRCCGNGRIQA